MIDLTDDELFVLDGKCRDEIQQLVESAKRRRAAIESNPDADPKIMALCQKAVDVADAQGELCFYYQSINHCDVCDKRGGYATYPRSGRHHRKGDLNYSKPRYMGGVELERRFVTMKGHVFCGCCRTCWDKAKPILASMLEDVRAAIPEEITGHAPRFIKYSRKKCKKCGWQGHEGELGLLPALMGGYYRGECPKCQAKEQLFNNVFEILDGFDLVEVPTTEAVSA